MFAQAKSLQNEERESKDLFGSLQTPQRLRRPNVLGIDKGAEPLLFHREQRRRAVNRSVVNLKGPQPVDTEPRPKALDAVQRVRRVHRRHSVEPDPRKISAPRGAANRECNLHDIARSKRMPPTGRRCGGMRTLDAMLQSLDLRASTFWSF